MGFTLFIERNDLFGATHCILRQVYAIAGIWLHRMIRICH